MRLKNSKELFLDKVLISLKELTDEYVKNYIIVVEKRDFTINASKMTLNLVKTKIFYCPIFASLPRSCATLFFSSLYRF